MDMKYLSIRGHDVRNLLSKWFRKKTLQLTLEQHGFTLRGSTYTPIFSSSKYCGTTWSEVGLIYRCGGTADTEELYIWRANYKSYTRVFSCAGEGGRPNPSVVQGSTVGGGEGERRGWGRSEKLNGTKCKQSLNLGKGNMGVLCTTLVTFLWVWIISKWKLTEELNIYSWINIKQKHMRAHTHTHTSTHRQNLSLKLLYRIFSVYESHSQTSPNVTLSHDIACYGLSGVLPLLCCQISPWDHSSLKPKEQWRMCLWFLP